MAVHLDYSAKTSFLGVSILSNMFIVATQRTQPNWHVIDVIYKFCNI